ncbi:MAG: hypothetical protein K0S32_2771 [Bacteroidetes bacterium]|jgi:hypothetical protein|nr:hypothetical protein [Bacteroidota bacterium]
MENVVPFKIQLLSIIGSLLFMFFIFRLIVKGKLREEYSIVWIACTLLLLVFAIWRNGLDIVAKMLGIYYAPALIFLAAIFAIIIFLVHLSVTNSRLQKQIKDLTQEHALMKLELEKKKLES